MSNLIWTGILGVATLWGTAALLVWYLFLSPLPESISVPATNEQRMRLQRGLVSLFLLSQGLSLFGAVWDAAWHQRFGLIREDFWWPPHIMMYTAFGLGALIAGAGIGFLLRLPGSIRSRFRAEPLVGLLALFSLYQFASGPVDEIWHRIYGKDIAALSVPHVLLALAGSLVALAAFALAHSLTESKPNHPLRWLSLGVMTYNLWGWTAVTLGDWEYALRSPVAPPPGNPIYSSAPWEYLLYGLIPLAFLLGAIRRISGERWAATRSILVANVVAWGLFLTLSLFGNPLPALASLPFLLGGAVVLDLWPRAGGVGFAAGYLTLAIPGTLFVTKLIPIDLSTILIATVAGLPLAWLSLAAGERIAGLFQRLQSQQRQAA